MTRAAIRRVAVAPIPAACVSRHTVAGHRQPGQRTAQRSEGIALGEGLVRTAGLQREQQHRHAQQEKNEEQPPHQTALPRIRSAAM